MYYEVNIPEPCAEDWSKMTPMERGRYCDSCEKEVLDFTNFSQREIALRIKNGENICGRFRKDQLERPYFLPEENSLKSWKLVAAFTSLLGFCSPALAQHSSDEVKTVKSTEGFIEDDSLQNKYLKDSITISGKVMEQEIPLPGAAITLEGTQLGANTDFDGNFSLIVPSHLLEHKDTSKLIISYVGFETKEYCLMTNRPKDLTVNMYLETGNLKLAAVMVGGIIIKKTRNSRPRSRWFRWRR
ncbi:MAG: carboxypeptidase-like regulatory domain-containing protein [Leeuwenhoekiella sp.]